MVANAPGGSRTPPSPPPPPLSEGTYAYAGWPASRNIASRFVEIEYNRSAFSTSHLAHPGSRFQFTSMQFLLSSRSGQFETEAKAEGAGFCFSRRRRSRRVDVGGVAVAWRWNTSAKASSSSALDELGRGGERGRGGGRLARPDSTTGVLAWRIPFRSSARPGYRSGQFGWRSDVRGSCLLCYGNFVICTF